MDETQDPLDSVFDPAPGDNYTPRQETAVEPEAKPEIGLTEAVGKSFKTDTLSYGLYDWASGRTTGYDPDFEVTEDMLKEAEESGIRPEHLTSLATAGDLESYQHRTNRLLEDYETDRELAKMGNLGTGIRLANAIVDPASWAVAAATGGTSKVQTASRVGKIGQGALRAGVSEGAIAAGIAATSPTYDWDNAMVSAGAGFLLGGALSSLGRTQHSGMTPSDSEKFDAVVSRTLGAIIQPSGSGGAARVAKKEPQSWSSMDRLRDAMDNEPATSYDLKVFGKSTRFDLQGALGQSKHPLVRGTALAKDAAGKEGGAVNPHSASEWKRREIDAGEGKLQRAMRPIHEKYKEAMGMKYLTPSKRREFNEGVGRAVRDRAQAASEAHSEAAEVVAGEFQRILKVAKESGVKGFEDINPNPNYLPRLYNRDKFLRLERSIGTEGVEKLIAGALRSEAGDVSAEYTATVAKAYVSTLRSLRVRNSAPLWNAQQGAARDRALATLKEELGEKVDEDVLENVFNLIAPAAKSSGMARTKSRLKLDETFAADIQNKSGTVSRVRLDDVLENDVEAILASYRNTVLGQSALARQGYASRADFDKHLQDIRNTAEEIEGYTTQQMDRDISRLEFLYNHVSGVPNFDTSEAMRTWTERLLKYNFARVMNKTGFAQMSELALMTNHAGVQVLMDGVPELKQLVSSIKSGTAIEDEMLDVIEQTWGFGTKTSRGAALARFVDVEGALERVGSTKADDFLHVAGNVTAIGSGLGPMTDAMQLMTAKAAIVKWAGAAAGGKRFLSKDRLAHLGIDDDMYKRINAELSSKGTYKGMRGQDLPKVDLDSWADVEAKDYFIAAIDRHTRRIIQENDIGQLAGVMTHPLARLVLQFKGFSIGSFSNHLLYGANMKDSMAVREMISTMFGGVLGYSAMIYASSIGRDDRAEYLEKRLNSEALAAAMVYRSSHAAFLPGMVDMSAQAFGYDPIFGYARNTGLDTSAVLSNPTFDLANNVMTGVGGTARAALDPNYDFSQEQFDALTRSMLFQNSLGIQNMLNITKAELPEKPQ